MKTYIKCGSDSDEVFMLMEYTADIGPDTTGMDGDDFYCVGKFYAPSLEEARSQFVAIKAEYPWIGKQSSKYTVRDYYVDKYNAYFDYQPEDEDDIDMNPSAMGGARYNVFSDLDLLISYLGWDKGPVEFGNDDEKLPFNNFEEEEEYDVDDNPEEGNMCRQALRDALVSIEVDPDYEDLASIIWDYNAPNGTYDFEFFFDDGDSFKHSFDLNEIVHCDSAREAASIIENSLHNALKQAGK